MVKSGDERGKGRGNRDMGFPRICVVCLFVRSLEGAIDYWEEKGMITI